MCCTFSGDCGGTTSINNTYFSGSLSQAVSPCLFSVCRVSSDVCQIRLSFDTFDISGPSSSANMPTANTASLAGQRTQCLEAQFRWVFRCCSEKTEIINTSQ